jgi:hypothetical protein
MAFKVIDRLFIVVYGVHDPTDAEWVGYLEDVERHGIERTQQLISTEGGGPNATQRRYLNELLDGRPVPVAVMSGSTPIRGVVTAMSWFNRAIRFFPPTCLLDALAYLEIPVSRAELIAREMAKLRSSLDQDERATA